MGDCHWAPDVGVHVFPGAKQTTRGETGARVDVGGWPETTARWRSTTVNPHWRIAQKGKGKEGAPDTTTPLSNTLQPLSHTTSTQVQPTSSQTQFFDGPITRSRAKKLQQEVHALLYEFHLNTNENFMLPKSCMLILLRFTKEEGQNISRVNQQDELYPSQTSATEPSRRNSHIF